MRALVDFKRAFGRDFTPPLLADMYVALELDLSPALRTNEPGFDLVSSDGKRYQVKERNPSTLNVDVNNFDFDYVVLVNMSDDYRVTGMWRLDVEQARSLFVYREKFRKHQATQNAVKNAAQRINIHPVF